MRGDAERESSSGFHRELRVWARDLVVAVGLAMIIIVFFYQPVKVEGTSMAPLLSDQERIFINKFVYHFEPIGRGDPWTARNRLSNGWSGCQAMKWRFAGDGFTLMAKVWRSRTFPRNTLTPRRMARCRYLAMNISSWAIIESVRMIRASSGLCRPHSFTAKPSLPIGLGLSSALYRP